jgi:GGDEF domain-containing protein
VLSAEFNQFKANNDVYGFPAGDEAIRLQANVLTEAVSEIGNPTDFLGHVGGDDFVAITTPIAVTLWSSA